MQNYLSNIKSYSEFISAKLLLVYKLFGFEGIVWACSLIFLAFINDPNQSHFTICPFANAGLDYCFGCGLGNSVSLILHGNIPNSFDVHLLGIPALIIILFRIIQLIRINYHIHFKILNKGVNHA